MLQNLARSAARAHVPVVMLSLGRMLEAAPEGPLGTPHLLPSVLCVWVPQTERVEEAGGGW